MTSEQHDVIIAGSGPAGLTAALYTARAQLRTLVLEGQTPGGQLTKTSFVENWPGTPSILGAQLVMNMKEHAQQFGAQFEHQTVTQIEQADGHFMLTTLQKKIFAKTIILAVGAESKKLTCPGEQEYWGKGVTICAICDGALYKNQPIVIVGGGDTAMEDATVMSTFTDNITIIQALDKLTAQSALQKPILQNPHIKIYYQHHVTNIEGNGQHVTQVEIQDAKTKHTKKLPSTAVFLAVGLKPNTDFLKNTLELDSYGYIKTKEPTTHTSISGIFACGDAVDYHYRQAITAAGSGCKAALEAQWHLQPHQ